MSTILNALRRLEEDVSDEENRSDESLPATEPRVRDQLRTRILEEELTAAAQADDRRRARTGKPLIRAVAAVAGLLVAIGLGVFFIAPGFVAMDDPASTPPRNAARVAPEFARASEKVQSTGLASTAPATPPTSSPSFDKFSERAVAPNMAIAAVTPTPAMREAEGIGVGAMALSPTDLHSRRGSNENSGDRARQGKSQSRPTPRSDLAGTASVAASPIEPIAQPGIPRESKQTLVDGESIVDLPASTSSVGAPVEPGLKPARDTAAVDSARGQPGRGASDTVFAETPVQQHIAPRSPDITVLQTAWHPRSDLRSARIHLIDDNETLTLKEGDAIGPLVVREITPSAVIFLTGNSGDVDLRIRVGRPASGD